MSALTQVNFVFFCNTCDPPQIVTLPQYEHQCGHCSAWIRRFHTVSQEAFITIWLCAKISADLLNIGVGQFISGDLSTQSLPTVSRGLGVGVGRPVTVTAGSCSAALATVTTIAKSPPAMSNRQK
jgi:hypothetical protein